MGQPARTTGAEFPAFVIRTSLDEMLQHLGLADHGDKTSDEDICRILEVLVAKAFPKPVRGKKAAPHFRAGDGVCLVGQHEDSDTPKRLGVVQEPRWSRSLKQWRYFVAEQGCYFSQSDLELW
jgi:hypothetical protein